jgi:hypothetical protein
MVDLVKTRDNAVAAITLIAIAIGAYLIWKMYELTQAPEKAVKAVEDAIGSTLDNAAHNYAFGLLPYLVVENEYIFKPMPEYPGRPAEGFGGGGGGVR